ncbi:MAG: hypothetical protein JJU20_06230 [Opitutales bacterium]|nr:hypothetical protein [Opitutales bacterium]
MNAIGYYFRMALWVVMLTKGVLLNAQSVESFEQLTASGIRYEAGSFTGDTGFVWHFYGARAVRANYVYSGTSIGFGTDSLELRRLEASLPDHGLSRLSFVIGPYFSAGVAADRGVEVWLNDNWVGSYWLESMDTFTEIDLKGLEYAGVVQLRIEGIGPRQIVLDNLRWWPMEAEAPVDPPDDRPLPPEEPDPPEEPEPEEPLPVPEEGFNPWRSDTDFLILLESLLPNSAGFDPGLWQWAFEQGQLNRLRALEIWFELESVYRLEVLFRAVWLLEGRFPEREEWSSEAAAVALFRDYLNDGQLDVLIHGILYERPFARLRLGSYDIHRPAVFWNLLWLHWAGGYPTAQQLVQMQYRLETFADALDSLEASMAAFLADFVERRPHQGQAFIHQQPAAVFEEKLMSQLLDAVCGFESFEQLNGLETSYRYADLPVQLWARLSHPVFLENYGLGALGSIRTETGYSWHPVYGWFWEAEPHAAWIYSDWFGWVWLPPTLAADGVWFWWPGQGWFWTNEAIFPWVWPIGGQRPFKLSFSH